MLQVFTHVMAPVSSIMHRFGFRILRYLDDWLVLGSSLQEIKRARDRLLALCSELGVQVNLSKSSLTPSQKLDYLGMAQQTSPLRAFPTQALMQKVLGLVEEFSSSPVQPLSPWRSLLGVMSSHSALIPGSRLRALQHRLQVLRPQASPTKLISWDDFCQGDLRWWSDPCHLGVGVNLAKTLIVSRSRTVNLPHPQVSVSGCPINNSDHLTILGVNFDSKFNFIDHLKSVSSVASRKIGIIRKAAFIHQDEKVNLSCFRSFVLPLLEYCSPVWMSATDSNLNVLSKIVRSAGFFFPGNSNYDLDHRRNIPSLCLFHKIYFNDDHSLHHLILDPYVPSRQTPIFQPAASIFCL